MKTPLNVVPGACWRSVSGKLNQRLKLVQTAAEGLDEWSKEAITERLREATFDGPSGPLTTDPSNQHMTQNAYIATIQPDKSFKLEETIENVVPQAGCTVS